MRLSGDCGPRAMEAELARIAEEMVNTDRSPEQQQEESNASQVVVKRERASSSEEGTNPEFVEDSRLVPKSESESESIKDPNEEEKEDEETLRKRTKKAYAKRTRAEVLKASVFPLHEHVPFFRPNKPRNKSLIQWPALTAEENPVRQLRYTHEMFQSFTMLKSYIRNKFDLLNTNFPLGQYNRCMNCWVIEMYPYEPLMKEET